MKKAAVICIGKIRETFWKNAADHYLKLISRWRRVELVELRDGAGTPGQRQDDESARILARLSPRDYAIALADSGKQMTSERFAEFLRQCDERAMMRPCFIIGGPYGLAEAIAENSRCVLSLSAMTWPHELARVLLLEQLYRAESILNGAPYHH